MFTRIFFFSLLFFSFTQAFCNDFKFVVYNRFDQPVEMATVVLFTCSDSTFVQGAITNQRGEFSFNERYHTDDYFIRISHLSYLTKRFILKKELSHKVILDKRFQSTGEVNVVARRKPIEFKEGKLIANVASSPSSDGANIVKVLKQLPGVLITGNKILLNGTPAVVYIDGKKQSIQGSGIIKYLEGLPSISMDKVELQSIGDGSTDASDGAIINFVSNKQKKNGYYGSIGVDAVVYEENHWGGASNAFYMFKKNQFIFNSSISLSNSFGWKSKHDSTLYSNALTVQNNSEHKWDLNKFVGTANLAWNSENGHLINLNLFGYNDVSNGELHQYIDRWNNGTPDDYRQKNRSHGNDDLWSANLEYSSPDSLGYKFIVSYGFDHGGIREDQDYYILDRDNAEETFVMKSSSKMIGTRNTFKIDFDKTFSSISLKLKAGSKIILGDLDQNVINKDELKTINPLEDSNFNGDENIYAAYLKLSKNITKNLTFMTSMRVEQTQYHASLNSMSNEINDKYTNFFPYAHFYFKPSRNYQLILGYISGIIRPNYEHLLPGASYENQYYYTKGNPYLRPSIVNGIALNNYLFGHGTINFRYQIVKDLEGQVLTKVDDDLVEYTYLNYADNRQFKINIFAPYQLVGKKLSGWIDFGAVYNSLYNFKNGFTLVDGRDRSYWKYNLKSGLDYQASDRLGFNSWAQYNHEFKSAQYDYGSNWSVDFGGTYKFFKDKDLTFSIVVENIFDSYKRDDLYYLNDMRSYQYSHNHGRFLKFSLSYKFNKGERIRDKARENVNDTSRFM